MDKEKIFVGSGTEIFNGNIINTNLCLSDLPKEFIYENNGKKFIKLKVVKRKTPSEKGVTHYVEVDTWKKEDKKDDLPY